MLKFVPGKLVVDKSEFLCHDSPNFRILLLRAKNLQKRWRIHILECDTPRVTTKG